MRLYNTLARDVTELPEPPGRSACTSAVPPSTTAHTSATRGRYVLASWYKRWLRLRGYDVTLVHNITDVNDKIYEAAPGASAERAEQATQWYLEDTGRFGLDEVDHWPKVTETMEEIVAFIVDLIERGFAYEVDGDVYFRVAKWAEYGRLSGQKPDQVEEQEPNERKEDPRDFALWKANKPDEDTWWDSPWGRGRPGWHIECSAMAEKLLGPVFEIHGGGLDLVFPHHENELAQSRARGHEFAKIWMHNGMLRFTGEKMSKSVGNVESINEVLDRWGPETTLVFFLTAHWRSPIDFSDDRLADAEARADGLREVFRNPSEPAPADAWERFTEALDDDFSTPQALALMHEWRDHELLRRALDVFGLASLAEQAEAPAEVHELARARQEAREAKDFGRRTAPRARSRQRGGTCGTIRVATGSCRRRVTREQVYGRRPVREALRGPREVLELWATERALNAEPWLRDDDGPRVQVKPDRELSEAAETRDHQGVLAWCEPYRYADAYELAAVERPLLACLDQVTDPRNLGAVIRSAEGAGATGVVVPAHGSALVTPAVCRASAGAVEHLPVAVVPNLARYLNEIKRGDLWIYAAAAEAEQNMWQADLTGGLALVFGAEGKGVRPLVRRACDATVSIPLAGSVESLNVSVAAALLLYEARRRRDG